jgi:peptidoglycan/xylan/chitin deacetylase (PgdA/CDA1 family)
MPALVKRALSAAAETAMFARFVSLIERFHQKRTNLLQVLTYHRIDDPRARPELAPSTLSATPAVFERQMAYLARRYRVVTVDEVQDACFAGKRLPDSAVLITFDDAYRDFEEHAWPILRRYALPAVLFVPTSYPDHPQCTFWWDRLYHALREANTDQRLPSPWDALSLATPKLRSLAYGRVIAWLKSQPHLQAMEWIALLVQRWQLAPATSHVLGWDALRRLAADGLAIGAHTRTHPLLHRVSAQVAYEEAAGSLADLRREIGDVPPVFAYPGGYFNAESLDAVRRAGFRLAFAGRRGINCLDRPEPLRLRRNHIGTGTSQNLFRARLLPWSIHLNRWRPVTGR